MALGFFGVTVLDDHDFILALYDTLLFPALTWLSFSDIVKVLILVYNGHMNTIQSQLKLNLPRPMKIYAENRANAFGMTMAAYIKHLIAKDIEELEKKHNLWADEAREEFKVGKTKELKSKDDIDKFMSQFSK